MGESRRKRQGALVQGGGEAQAPQVVDTLGGRMHVQWDPGAAATPHGQLVFFAEFLAATGVFEQWVSSCPLAYRSGNAPDKRDVLGTLMLGLLAGHRRYAHITALRGDAVAAQALGMNKVVSEDALRRALERIDQAASSAWMRPALMHSVREALDKPWVLDIDASIKPLYGRQEGAAVGYNPAKPGRPSHALHTFWVGNLRLVLDVQVSAGKQHSSVHAKTLLGQLLDELQDKRPALVRGDSGYGNEGMLLMLEQRAQPYLLRLRQTANVQRLVAQQFARQDWSRADGQGCQMVEAQLQLHGWSKRRRVVVVRQRIKGGIARERRVDGRSHGRSDGRQLKLELLGASVHEGDRLWEYAVMVTDVAYPIEAIGQLYRDRADCENGFDELKNQWGRARTRAVHWTVRAWRGAGPPARRGLQGCRASRRRTSIAARPRPGRARWFTTGGVGTAGPPHRRPGWKPSRAARCCWQRWAGPRTAAGKRRCTLRRCMARPNCSSP